MTWIQPLELKTIFVNIFSGSIGIFTAVAIITIVGMAAFFRMTFLNLLIILGLFFMMFAGILDKNIVMVLLVVGSMLIGYWISKIVK